MPADARKVGDGNESMVGRFLWDFLNVIGDFNGFKSFKDLKKVNNSQNPQNVHQIPATTFPLSE